MKIDFERTLMREQIVDRNVVHRPIRCPEPRQRIAERAYDVLCRGHRDVALVGGAAE